MKMKFIIFLFMAIWLGILSRVYYLSVKSNDFYEKLSSQNSIKIEKIAPIRGEILDINKKPVAINELGFKVLLAPHLGVELESEVDELLELLPDFDKEKIIKEYKKNDSYYNHKPIEVIPFVSYEQSMPVYTKLSLKKNVEVVSSPKRYYPYEKVAAHVLGYVARANTQDVEEDPLLELIGYKGKSGLENYYNDYLQGEAGEREVKVNAKNQKIEELSYIKPDEDRTLILNIDIELQEFISTLFENKSGAVVVMGVDGAVLAASSFPEYNLNSFISGISSKEWDRIINSLEKPFTNKLINGLYPPGSIIKNSLGLIFLTSNEVGKNFNVFCTAELPVGNRVFRCWKGIGHGHTDVIKAIRESCDDYFYKGSLKLGIDKMSRGFLNHGLGAKTGIDLPNEFIGTVPSREWKMQRFQKQWYIGETVNTSIGQGDFLTSPMQIAANTALMATGKLPTPRLVKYKGDEELAPAYRDVLSKDELQALPTIQKAMYEVCNSYGGTARNYLNTKVKIAGKTGTAQVVGIKQNIKQRELEHEMAYYNRSHAWMSTYGPYDKPKYVVSVMVEHGGHGGAATGGIVSAIYDKLVELGYIELDESK